MCTCMSSSATLFLSSSSSACSRAVRSDEHLLSSCRVSRSLFLSSRSCSRAWAASLLFSSYLPLRSFTSAWKRLTRARSASSSRWASCADWPVRQEERTNDDTGLCRPTILFWVSLKNVDHLNWLLCAVVGVLYSLHLTASQTPWSWLRRPEHKPPAAGRKPASYGSSPEPVLRNRERWWTDGSSRKQQERLIWTLGLWTHISQLLLHCRKLTRWNLSGKNTK